MARAREIPFFSADENVKGAVRRILLFRIKELYSFEAATLKGDDREALHDMRVASRRLQAVLKIFRPLFPQKRFQRYYDELKQLIRMLGAVRELDVFILHMERRRVRPLKGMVSGMDLILARRQTLWTKKRAKLFSLLAMQRKKDFQGSLVQFVMNSLA